MKFTDADFASAITATTMRPKRQLRLTISSSNLRLPVALLSPLFDGINEDIDTDRFPAFEDALNICQSVPTPAPHCTLHCSHRVCAHLTRDSPGSPKCQCEPEEEETAISCYRPEMDFNYLVMSSIRKTLTCTNPSQEIDIHYTEALKILAHLENRAVSGALQKEHLRYAMRHEYPEQEVEATLTAVHHFFRILRLYFHRTLRSPNHRSISINRLRCELNVYLWTLLAEWVGLYCDSATRDHVLEVEGPDCVIKADFGASAAVLEFWRECIEDILGLLVWRDEEVRWSKVESAVMSCILTVLFLWAFVMFLLGHVGSHTRYQ